jgi:hypothetical protein
MHLTIQPQNIRQKLMEVQEKVNEFTTIDGDFNSPLSEIDR